MNKSGNKLQISGLLRLAGRCSALAALALLALSTMTPLPTAAQAAASTVASTTPTVDRTTFDHLTTGFELIGQHRDLACELCHVNAIFKGTPRDCASCHGVGTQVKATAKPNSHILTTNRCEGCHTPVAWNPAVNFDHAQVQGSCSSCHNNVQAQGKGPTHMDTNLECNACHSTIGWAGAVFGHPQVTTGCVSCHGPNLAAKGMPDNHVPIGGAGCESCHTPTYYLSFMFPNASGTAPPSMVHTAAGLDAANCITCHEAGVLTAGSPATKVRPAVKASGSVHVATGQCSACHLDKISFKGAIDYPANHIPLPNGGSAVCTTCHTDPANFQTYTMNHTVVSSESCATCHGPGLSFAGMAPPTLVLPPGNHVSYLPAGCESCHLASSTAVGGFKFTNVSGTAPAAMVHTAVSSYACATCHAAGKTDVGVPATLVMPGTHVPIGGATCESCHLASSTATGGFKLPSNVSGTAPPSMVHAAVASAACATCHGAGKTDIGVPATIVPPANHVPFGSAACESCHLASSTATGGFRFTNASGTAPAAMVHSAVSGMACASCHAAGKTDVGVPATVTPPGNHIPFGTAACEGCHLASGTATGGFKFSNLSGLAPPSMVHTLVTGIACSTCHEKGLSWAGQPVTVLRPPTVATHVQTGECSDCHSSTVSFKGASNFPANHIPVPNGDASTCSACHANPGDYLSYTMDHTVVTSESCATCHGAGKSFAGMAPPVLKLPPANHVPFGAVACESCHLNTSTATGGFKFTNASGTTPSAMVHSAVSGVACATCHAAGKTDVGVPATVTPPGNHVPFGTAACESCHLSSSVATGGFRFANVSGTAPSAMVHSAVASMTCATCHATGKVWVGTPATVLPPSNHIPFGAAACEGCHLKTSVATGGFQFTNATGAAPPSMVHSLVSAIVCSTCHEAGKSWAGTPITVVRPANKADNTAHVAAGECSTCHFNTTSFKGASDLPANHIPLPAADANNCALCHTTAGNYSLAVMNHVNITSNCAQCHAAGLSFANMAPPTLVLPPSNHVPFGTVACEKCHLASSTATGGFKFSNLSGTAPASMVHSAVPGVACATCHATGKSWVGTPATVLPPANHVPFGTAACESCHLNTSVATGGFKFTNASGTAPSAMVHSVVASMTCATCHAAGKVWAGTPATVLPPSNHIPFGAAACEGCHLKTSVATGGFKFTNATGTAPPSMVHSLVSATVCSTCHEAGKTWVGTPITVVRPAKKANNTAHVTGGECSTCHLNTTSFKGATDLPANHIPLPAADANNCSLCHTTAGNYSLYVMNHVNITGNCAQCHAYGLSFANMAPPQLVQPPSGPTGHIPSNPPNGTAAIACEQCHLKTVFTSFAGTKMIHAAVRTMTCMSCHELGMKWKTNTGVRLWVRDGADHYKGRDCGGSGCHSTRDKFAARRAAAVAVTRKAGVAGAAGVVSSAGAAAGIGGAAAFNHQRVAGSACVSCHGPATTIGKPGTHIATSDACASCHTTLSWLPVARVDHLQVKGSCVSCHNKVIASGKGSAHIASGDSCETCHTTNAWTPARFDHNAVVAHTCNTCHNGLRATGLPGNHVPTSAQCDTCHGTLGWKPAKLDHSILTANCVTCHNNKVALGVTAAHMSTQRDCATCHSYPDWAVSHFVHVSAAYPGDHKAALTCVSCHASNTDQIPWLSPGDAGSCAGCHAKDFKPELHAKSSGGLKYTAAELHNCAGACHVYSDATLGTVVKSLPGPYHRVSDATFKH